MKKIKLISLIVCLALLLGSTVSGVAATGATDTTEPSETSEQTHPLPQSGDVAFGSLPTSSGCRTIDGMVSLLNAWVGYVKHFDEYMPYVR